MEGKGAEKVKLQRFSKTTKVFVMSTVS